MLSCNGKLGPISTYLD